MPVWQLLTDLFLLRSAAYRHACNSPRASFWASGFLALTGILYGLLLAMFQRALGVEVGGVPVARIPDTLLLTGNLISGLLIVLVFHGGATLVVWLMARAVGGPGRLAEVYRGTAYVLPLSWPGLLRLSFHGAVHGSAAADLAVPALYNVLGLFALCLVSAGLYQLLRVTQEIGPGRAVAGVFLVVLFSYTVLLISSG